MGREVRRVPADWQHPKDDGRDGRYIPLHEGADLTEQIREWDEGMANWQKGLVDDHAGGLCARTPDDGYRFADYTGDRPSPDDYMPNWPAAERTHLMMYEDTSEGTPISPAFATPEELARWLADNNASAFGRGGATYEQWLATCRGAWAPSMVMDEKGLRSGVEFAAERAEKKATDA